MLHKLDSHDLWAFNHKIWALFYMRERRKEKEIFMFVYMSIVFVFVVVVVVLLFLSPRHSLFAELC